MKPNLLALTSNGPGKLPLPPEVLATGSHFVYAHLIDDSRIAHYQTTCPDELNPADELFLGIMWSFQPVNMHDRRRPNIYRLPRDRRAARKQGLPEASRPMLLTYYDCIWYDETVGFRPINLVKHVQPADLDELHRVWGLDAPPKWYRLKGPQWTKDEFQISWTEKVSA